MDFALIIGLAKWFLLRQIEKFAEKIDWNKVADDFVDRIGKMIPQSVFGDLEKANVKAYMEDFGKRYESRAIASLYGTGQFLTAFEACFGDTDSAKLSACQEAYLVSLKPAKVEPKKPEDDKSGGFFRSKKEELTEKKPDKKEGKKGSKTA